MQYIMKGGNPLVGEVVISGAKNAALGILAAAIMTDDSVIIDNLPDVRDIRVLLDAMKEIGVIVAVFQYGSSNSITSSCSICSGTGISNRSALWS